MERDENARVGRLRRLTPYRATRLWWLICGTSLTWANIIFGIIAIICTTLVASKILPDPYDQYSKCIAVISTTLLTFLDAKDAKTRFFAAQNHLSDTMNLYLEKKFKFDFSDVIEARREGLNHITKNTPLPDLFEQEEDDN